MPTNVPLFVNMNDVEPRQDSVGRFTFNLPFLGIATLFPNTWPNKLDPSRVHGLNEEGETT
jgi:hypothetical protein